MNSPKTWKDDSPASPSPERLCRNETCEEEAIGLQSFRTRVF